MPSLQPGDWSRRAESERTFIGPCAPRAKSGRLARPTFLLRSSMQTRPHTFQAGESIWWKGQEYFYKGPKNLTQVLALGRSSGFFEDVPLSEIHTSPTADQPREELSNISEKDLREAQRRYDIIKPLLGIQNRKNPAYRRISIETGIAPSTLYRWRKQYLSTGQILALVRDKPGPKSGQSTLVK